MKRQHQAQTETGDHIHNKGAPMLFGHHLLKVIDHLQAKPGSRNGPYPHQQGFRGGASHGVDPHQGVEHATNRCRPQPTNAEAIAMKYQPSEC